MSNPTLTVGELPEGTAAPQDDPTELTENLYDSLDPPEVSYMYMYKCAFPPHPNVYITFHCPEAHVHCTFLIGDPQHISKHKALGVVLPYPTLVA